MYSKPRVLFWLTAVAASLAARWAAAAEVSFIRDVAPILLQRCVGCHGPTKVEGDLRLHTFDFLLKPGATGAAPVVAGEPDESELFMRLVETDAGARMPQQDDPLSEPDVDVIRRWIAAGARFDGRDRKASFKSQLPPREHPQPPEAYPLPVPVYAVAFAPDGRELAVGGHHEVTVWDPATGGLLRRIRGLPERTQALAYAPAGATLVVAGGSPGDYGELTALDLSRPDQRRTLGTFEDVALGAAVSRDGTRVAVASADRSVRAYSLADGRLLWQSGLHSDWATCVAFSHDDRFLASGSRDFTIKVLEAATGELFTTYNGHQRQLGKETGRFEVFALAFSDESPLAFSAGEGRSIRVWEPEKAQVENGSAADMEIRFFKAGHTRYIAHESKHPVFRLVTRGKDLFVVTGDGLVRQFNAESLEAVRSYAGHRDWVFAADFHPQSQRLATGAFDGEVRIWNTATGELVKAFLAAPGYAMKE